MNANMAEEEKNKNKLDLKVAELDQIYELSLELLKKSQDPDRLLDALLDEYIRRFSELSGMDLLRDVENYPDEKSREKMRSLIMFSKQAELIKENADYQAKLKERNRELAQLTQKLRRANQELKRLNSHYLNMLGFVSHELRSPLISILGFAELLEEGILGELNVEQQNSVQVIIRVTRNLIDMIRNYLDLAQIEGGELAIEWQNVNLYHEIIMPVINELEGHLLAKKMKVVAENDESVIAQYQVEGDSGLLKIAFTNILSNAIKYGRAQTDIVYQILDLDNKYVISITNEGEGVPEDKLEKIFNKFSQMVHYHPDQPRGTGLGLFNTKCIIRAHGGKIWAESEVGKWFRINITLPKHPRKKPRFVKLQRSDVEWQGLGPKQAKSEVDSEPYPGKAY